MTTFPLHAGSSSSLAQTSQRAPTRMAASDLMALTSDMDSLAQHMRHCAGSRSRWSRLQRALESTHSLLSPRIVTAAALMAVVTLSLAVVLGWVAAV